MKYHIMCNIFLHALCYKNFIRPAWKIKANKCQKNINSSLKCAELKKENDFAIQTRGKIGRLDLEKAKKRTFNEETAGFGPFCGKKMSNRQVFHLIALKNTHQIDIR